MKEETIKRAIKAVDKNHSFGIPISFEGRCIQVYPTDKKDYYEISSGCYSNMDVPEYNALIFNIVGVLVELIDMGKSLKKFKATMTRKQLEKYLLYADFAEI